MWIFVSIFVALLLALLWVLYARIVLCVDSYHNQYYLSLGGLIRIEPLVDEQHMQVRVSLPFYRFIVDPFKKKADTLKVDEKPKRTRQSGRSLKASFYFNRVIDVIRTFSFRHLMIDIDTGDFAFNAKLTPILLALNQRGARFQVNYQGNINYWIEVENRLVRFVPIVFKLVKKKYL